MRRDWTFAIFMAFWLLSAVALSLAWAANS